MPQARLRGTRRALSPNPSTAPASLRSQNQCTVQQSVTGTRVQSNPSARFATMVMTSDETPIRDIPNLHERKAFKLCGNPPTPY